MFCLDYLDYSHLRYPAVLCTWPAPRRRLARRFVGPAPVCVPKGNAQLLLCNPLLVYFILYNILYLHWSALSSAGDRHPLRLRDGQRAPSDWLVSHSTPSCSRRQCRRHSDCPIDANDSRAFVLYPPDVAPTAHVRRRAAPASGLSISRVG